MSADDMLKWISENKQWLLSGLGVVIITAVLSIVRRWILAGFSIVRRWILSGRGQRPSPATPISEATVGRPSVGHNEGELTDEIPLTTQTLNLSFGDHRGAHALTMSDGQRVRAEVHLAWRVINPYRFLFSSKDHPFDVLVPLLLSRLRGFMEGLTFDHARARRREAEDRVTQDLGLEFDKRGIKLESVTIGAMEKVARTAAKTSEQAPAPFTTHLNRVTFANGITGAVEAGFVYRVVDPVLYTYEADKPLDILISIADSRCRQMLERHSISDARTQREDLEKVLVDSLQPDFAKYGLQIDSFYIGSIRDVASNPQF
jgi:regulator of protease activity HflC (stomatin/prohibitin superfamily)